MNDLNQQLAALSELGLWEWPRDAHGLVAQGLESDDTETRLLALESAAESFDQALLGRVVQLLHGDPELDVRAAAAVSLGPALELMSDEMFEDDLQDDDLDPEEARELPLTLADYRALENDLQGLFNDTEAPPELRRRCLEAAVRSPRPWHEDAIRRALDESGLAWRLTAIFCAGYVQGFRGEICEALDDPSPEVRMEAIRSAGEGEIKELGPEILDLAKDPETLEPLRIASVEALVTLNPPGTEALLDSLSQGDGDLAEMATLVLEELANMQAAENSAEFSESEDEDHEEDS